MERATSDEQNDGQPASRGRDPGLQFVSGRPADLHTASLTHRYRHYVRTVPARIEATAPELCLTPGARVLDYGCADLPYRHCFSPDVDYVAADLRGNPRATVLLNADGSLPLADDGFDAVLSTQVLEHVRDPALYLRECYRVLRPGGRVMLSTHGVFVYHPDPEDYWRWTSAGLEQVLRDAGLRMMRLEGVIGLIAIGLQLVQDAVYYHLPKPFRGLLAMLMQSAIAVADRVQSDGSKRLNASVFIVIAEKPARVET